MFFLGIHREGDTIKYALLKKEGKKIEVKQQGCCPPSDVKQLYIEATVVSGLDAQAVLLRELPLALKARKQVLAVLPFQAESLLPYPLEEALLFPILRPSGVLLLSAKKESLEQHLQQWDRQPDVVSCVPFALWRTASFLYPEMSTLLAMHWSAQKGSVVYIEEGKIKLSITARISGEADFERVKSFIEQKTGKAPVPYLLSGDRECPVRSQFQVHQKEAIPLGLALDALKADDFSLQLRQGPYLSPSVKKKERKLFRSYILACGVAAAVLWSALGIFEISKKAQLYKQVKLAFPSAKGESFEEDLEGWRKSLLQQKKRIAPPNVPSVSDLLVWLSTHPKLKEADMQKVRYRLVQMPTLSHPKEPYAAQVELEFLISSSQLAKEFYDALLAREGLVHAKKEIGWHANQNLYTASFFLKNK